MAEEIEYLCVDEFMKTLVDCRALAGAFELGLIDRIFQTPGIHVDDLRRAGRCDERGFRFLLDLLAANHVIEENNGEIKLTQSFLRALQFRDLLVVKLEFTNFVAADVVDHFTTLIQSPQHCQGSLTLSCSVMADPEYSRTLSGQRGGSDRPP
jgi:hypothetical protein